MPVGTSQSALSLCENGDRTFDLRGPVPVFAQALREKIGEPRRWSRNSKPRGERPKVFLRFSWPFHDVQRAITPEIAAAVAKLMSNKDLVLAAGKIRNVTRCRNTMGQRGVLGIRVQPNHPADDLGGILLATVDGLLFGCGDAVLGVNPATDSVDTVSAILSA